MRCDALRCGAMRPTWNIRTNKFFDTIAQLGSIRIDELRLVRMRNTFPSDGLEFFISHRRIDDLYP